MSESKEITVGPDSWIAAAVAQKVDTDQLRELLAIKREHDADIARRAFAEAMCEVQAALPTVGKDRQNLQTNSRYATMDAIVSACMPVVAGHGFSVSYGTDKTDLAGCVGITMTVRHRAGHAESVRCDIPLDLTGIAGKANKTALHAHGSTMTYGQRYLFKLFFNLATGDDTDGNDPGAAIPPKAAHAAPPAGKPEYPEEKFLAQLPVWRGLIASGSKTAAAIIATVSSRFTMTKSQRARLTANAETGEIPPEDNSDFFAAYDAADQAVSGGVQ